MRLVSAAVLMCALALVASPAHADPIGGLELARTHVTVVPEPDADPLPRIKAASWVLADADTGEVLAHKGAHVRRAPASTLKMLTALTVLPRLDPQGTWTATRKAAFTYGSRVGLRPGRAYTLDELWHAVFLPSANDAAIAVAQANGGVKSTVMQMNEVARDLNALDTHAVNTSGLDAPGQLSSAYDLALIARAGMRRPDFAGYAGTARATFPDVRGKGRHPIYTTNRLLLHRWKGMLGVKTGFTSRAGRTYVGMARRDGRTLLVTLMGIRESSEVAARDLLTWGFANADRVRPVGTLVEAGPSTADPGTTSSTAQAAAADASPRSGDDPAAAPPKSAPASTPQSATLAPVTALGGVLLAGAVAGSLLLRRRRKAFPVSP